MEVLELYVRMKYEDVVDLALWFSFNATRVDFGGIGRNSLRL